MILKEQREFLEAHGYHEDGEVVRYPDGGSLLFTKNHEKYTLDEQWERAWKYFVPPSVVVAKIEFDFDIDGEQDNGHN